MHKINKWNKRQKNLCDIIVKQKYELNKLKEPLEQVLILLSFREKDCDDLEDEVSSLKGKEHVSINNADRTKRNVDTGVYQNLLQMNNGEEHYPDCHQAIMGSPD